MGAPEWFKSSYSDFDSANCLEVALQKEEVTVRDTKDVERPMVDFSARSWEKFVFYITR